MGGQGMMFPARLFLWVRQFGKKKLGIENIRKRI